MKILEFVIAKYKEDASWVTILEPHKITIYDKSNGTIPNIGRETHTYLHHIVNNYDNLADVTVFLQGNPFDHTTLSVSQAHSSISIDELSERIKNYPFEKTEPFFTEFRYVEYKQGAHEFYKIMFGHERNPIVFNSGAQWIVQKKDILGRPLEFYKKLYEISINFTITSALVETSKMYHIVNGWVFERLWGYIFDPSIPISPDIYDINI